MTENQLLITSLITALEKESLNVFYQPQVGKNMSEVFGIEALARWYDHEFGNVSPSLMIMLMGEAGKLYDFDCLICKLVFRDIKEHLSNVDIKVAINLCVSTLIDDNFYHYIVDLANEFKIDLKSITFEIIETHKIANYQLFNKRIDALKKLGIKISLDDYGTGHNNDEVLCNILFDELKIDRSYLNYVEDQMGIETINKVINRGKSRNMDVVVEGIETLEQLKVIEKTACDAYQGYYFSKPIPIIELLKMLNINSMVRMKLNN